MAFQLTPQPRRHDDPGIANDSILYRIINEDSWIVQEGDRERVASHAFKDTHTFETSCFVDKTPDQLRELFPGKRICGVTARVVREQEFSIARAPEEFGDDPSHVVLFPPGGLKRKEADRRWARISLASKIIPLANEARPAQDAAHPGEV